MYKLLNLVSAAICPCVISTTWDLGPRGYTGESVKLEQGNKQENGAVSNTTVKSSSQSKLERRSSRKKEMSALCFIHSMGVRSNEKGVLKITLIAHPTNSPFSTSYALN